jgi:hypothetical protein
MKEILVLIEVIKLVKVKKATQRSKYNNALKKYNINKRADKKLEEAESITFIRELQKQHEIPPNPRATYNEIHAFIVMVLETGNSGTKVLNIFKGENNKSRHWRKVIARESAGKLFKQVLLSYIEHPAIIRMKDNKMYNEKDILNSSLTGALNKLYKQLALSNAKDADKNDKVILNELLTVKNKVSSENSIDWIEVQRYRNQGMTIRKLAGVFGVSKSTIANNTGPK